MVEVSVLEAEGLPEGCCVSVCTGALQKQTPAKQGRLLLPPVPREGRCWMRLELLAPTGSMAGSTESGGSSSSASPAGAGVVGRTSPWHLALHISETHVAADMDTSMEKPDATTSAVPLTGVRGLEAYGNLAAPEGAAYLAEHGLLPWLEGLLRELSDRRPANPWVHIEGHAARARRCRGAPPAAARGQSPPAWTAAAPTANPVERPAVPGQRLAAPLPCREGDGAPASTANVPGHSLKHLRCRLRQALEARATHNTGQPLHQPDTLKSRARTVLEGMAQQRPVQGRRAEDPAPRSEAVVHPESSTQPEAPTEAGDPAVLDTKSQPDLRVGGAAQPGPARPSWEEDRTQNGAPPSPEAPAPPGVPAAQSEAPAQPEAAARLEAAAQLEALARALARPGGSTRRGGSARRGAHRSPEPEAAGTRGEGACWSAAVHDCASADCRCGQAACQPLTEAEASPTGRRPARPRDASLATVPSLEELELMEFDEPTPVSDSAPTKRGRTFKTVVTGEQGQEATPRAAGTPARKPSQSRGGANGATSSTSSSTPCAASPTTCSPRRQEVLEVRAAFMELFRAKTPQAAGTAAEPSRVQLGDKEPQSSAPSPPPRPSSPEAPAATNDSQPRAACFVPQEPGGSGSGGVAGGTERSRLLPTTPLRHQKSGGLSACTPLPVITLSGGASSQQSSSAASTCRGAGSSARGTSRALSLPSLHPARAMPRCCNALSHPVEPDMPSAGQASSAASSHKPAHRLVPRLRMEKIKEAEERRRLERLQAKARKIGLDDAVTEATRAAEGEKDDFIRAQLQKLLVNG